MLKNVKIKFIKRKMHSSVSRMKFGRILEFFIIGVVVGIIEDIIAVKASTGAIINWKIVGIVALVAIPFAVLSEIVVDHFKPFHKKRKK